MSQPILLATTPTVPGYRVKKVLGVVHGLTIRTRGMWGKWLAGIKSMFGGKIGAYVTELKKARDEALNSLVQDAMKLGANAVIGIDFETSDLLGDLIMVAVHGTAVILEPEEGT